MEPYLSKIYQPVLLGLVIASLLENVFFILLTIKPLHRLCYLHRRRRKFAFLARTRVNIRSLAYSIQSTAIPFPVQIVAHTNVFAVASQSSDRQPNSRSPKVNQMPSDQRLQFRSRCISAESNEAHCYSTKHRFTFYYFCSLCTSITLLMSATLVNILIEVQTNRGHIHVADERRAIHCLFVGVALVALVMLMSFSLVQLTTDRLIAIFRPFHYWRIMSSWKCLTVIAAGWSVSILFALVPYIHLRLSYKPLRKDFKYCYIIGLQGSEDFRAYSYAFIILVFIIPLCFILWAYAKIYRIVKQSAGRHAENHARYLRQAETKEPRSTADLTLKNGNVECRCFGPPQSAAREPRPLAPPLRCRCFSNLSRTACSQVNHETENRDAVPFLSDYLRKAKSAKSAVWILSSFYGLTLPYICPKCRSVWLDSFERTSVILVYTATVITPVIYAFRDGVLKKRMDSFFRSLKLACVKSTIPNILKKRQE
uniref:G_PROTEIN_RECEP_F1_2 domain-containing protein n=1 Tax=Mesocestoides corti TaxID=53468 RepID=A0A5K3EKZ6_MESCO